MAASGIRPTDLIAKFDVVVAVVPCVPIDEIIFLPGDARRYERRVAFDSRMTGIKLLEQTIVSSTRLLHMGGSLVLELGGKQGEQLAPVLRTAGFDLVERLVDCEDDLRGVDGRVA